MLTLRPKQQEVLNYRGGRMGVAAVPGSGKTWTLSLLAAEIITRGDLADDQEVLLVTLVNSAVDNFYQRVSAFIQDRGLLPNLGYRVRTLHGLAHDIVRERPDLAGLPDDFRIIDERAAAIVRDEAAQAWLVGNPYDLDELLSPELDADRSEWVRQEQLPLLVRDIAASFIGRAKDLQLTPQTLRSRLDETGLPLPLAEMGAEIYAAYQRALDYRGAVDFDDLIRLALQVLQADPAFLARLQHRWPVILEDEAQDSSRLQEAILSLLSGPEGNWVRMGDPNQAIYETFTTASPRYLREFLQRADVHVVELPNSGRSTYSIINLGNALVDWTQSVHPVEEVREALSAPPYIEPTPHGDPQPNPPDDPSKVHLVEARLTPSEEITAVVDSLARWLPEHPQATVAVLAPRNVQGFELVNELRRRNLAYVDSLLRSSSSTRFSAGVLGNLLLYLAEPQSPTRLATVYRVWRRFDRDDEEARLRMEKAAGLLRKLNRVEDFLWPGQEGDWLDQLGMDVQDPELYEQLVAFRGLVRRWQGAIVLPIDQVVITLTQDLLTEPSEMAIAYKLAGLLRQASQDNPTWRLPELSEELAVIARNERRFLGFGEGDSGFDPDQHPGAVVVATLHKAKGLEWDRVYLMSVNDYDFPSGEAGEDYIAEKWYVRDGLNLEAEALAQLEAVSGGAAGYETGLATHAARLDYARERLRLLYVGITRARKELIVTSNTGRRGDRRSALPLLALQEFWEQHLRDLH